MPSFRERDQLAEPPRRRRPGRGPDGSTASAPSRRMITPLTTTASMPVGPGDQSLGAGRLVGHPLERAAAHGGGIEHDDVGRPIDRQPTPVGEAEDVGRLGGELAHGLLERQRLALAHPPRQQVGREARVAQLAGVGAGVGQADHRVRIGQQGLDLVLVVVQHRHAEAGLEPGLDGQVEHEVGGVDAALVGQLGHVALVERRGRAGTTRRPCAPSCRRARRPCPRAASRGARCGTRRPA